MKQVQKGVINFPISFTQVAVPHLSVDYTPHSPNDSTGWDYHHIIQTTLSSCNVQISWNGNYINILIIGY